MLPVSVLNGIVKYANKHKLYFKLIDENEEHVCTFKQETVENDFDVNVIKLYDNHKEIIGYINMKKIIKVRICPLYIQLTIE